MSVEKRLPQLSSVSIADDTSFEEVAIPQRTARFDISVVEEGVTGYWALESGTTNRHRIPAGGVSVKDLSLPDGGTLYLSASAATAIEVAVYERA